MFDVGFSELVLVFIVGLVVLGPQRLPVAIRTVMGWVRTIRGLAANVQNELAQELKLQELQESIKKAEQLNLNQLSPDLAKTVEELKTSAAKMKANLDQKAAETNTSIQEQIEALREQNAAKTAENPTALSASSSIETAQLSENNEYLPEDIAEQAEMDEKLAKMLNAYAVDDDLATPEQPQSHEKQS
ncbi:MAG: Sec-independent protein translocase protein TatB [Lonepinella koalarum]|nr:Sec-independent protein translocase protein TatB [Lonepinella koalarum]